MVNIRKVQHGDENNLAYIQTESWKEAFKDIVPADLLSKCTGIERATAMYKRLLDENKGNGYILELDGKPHCIAWWDASRQQAILKSCCGCSTTMCVQSDFMKNMASRRAEESSLRLARLRRCMCVKSDSMTKN